MMTYKEAIKIIETAKAEIEWNCPLDYQTAFDMAISALKEENRREIDYMIEYIRYEYCYTCSNCHNNCPIYAHGMCINHIPTYFYYDYEDEIRKAYEFIRKLEDEND